MQYTAIVIPVPVLRTPQASIKERWIKSSAICMICYVDDITIYMGTTRLPLVMGPERLG